MRGGVSIVVVEGFVEAQDVGLESFDGSSCFPQVSR